MFYHPPESRKNLFFSDDGKLLVVADGKTMRVWETAGWTERKPLQPDDRKIVLRSFAGKRMYVGDESGEAYLWDLALLEKQIVPEGWRTGYWTALSANGKQLAMSGWKAAPVVLRDVATGKERHRLELATKKDAAVKGVCYSPDGNLLAIGGQETQMICIDSETGKETVRFGDQEVD